MSMLRCEFCDKNIDTDHDPEHFHEHRDGMCQVEQEQLKFPIYCKDNDGSYVSMIIDPINVLSIRNMESDIAISLSRYGNQDHYVYEAYTRRELTEVPAKDFHFHRIEINNRLISAGVSKKDNTLKLK